MNSTSGPGLAPSLEAINAIRDARSSALKGTHKSILYALASMLNAKKVSKSVSANTGYKPLYLTWPSYTRIAGDAGVSRSTCITAIDYLIKAGFLLKQRRNTEQKKSNIYAINVYALKLLARKTRKNWGGENDPVP